LLGPARFVSWASAARYPLLLARARLPPAPSLAGGWGEGVTDTASVMIAAAWRRRPPTSTATLLPSTCAARRDGTGRGQEFGFVPVQGTSVVFVGCAANDGAPVPEPLADQAVTACPPAVAEPGSKFTMAKLLLLIIDIIIKYA
jgi:hypothetical protein